MYMLQNPFDKYIIKSHDMFFFSSQVFAELFDQVIDDRHGGYGPDQKHPTDLNPTKLKGGTFDPKYVLSSRVRTGRSIRGLTLPPICSRAERREVSFYSFKESMGSRDRSKQQSIQRGDNLPSP